MFERLRGEEARGAASWKNWTVTNRMSIDETGRAPFMKLAVA